MNQTAPAASAGSDARVPLGSAAAGRMRGATLALDIATTTGWALEGADGYIASGTVSFTAYTSGTGALTVNVTAVGGSGTYAAWTIGLSAPSQSSAALLSTSSYADPAWLTSLSASKLVGTVTIAGGGTGAATPSIGQIFSLSLASEAKKAVISPVLRISPATPEAGVPIPSDPT